MTDDLWGDTAGAGFENFQISNRDRALFLIGERDLEAQLIAIKSVLRQNRQAEEQVAEAIKALDAQIRNYAGDDDEYQIHMENHWVDTLHGTVFQDAAHSMSAVGMLAPFVESLFVSIFAGLRNHRRDDDSSDRSDARRTMSDTDFWDPHFVSERAGRRTDLVAGIRQLAVSVGLVPFLPDDCDKVLTALIAYRNRMFHHGFEWPMEERRKFEEHIQSGGWPEGWFKKSTSGGEPWVFYMSDDFIEHCLEMIDQVLEGVGRYIEQGRTGQI